jgi:hypothetical protein
MAKKTTTNKKKNNTDYSDIQSRIKPVSELPLFVTMVTYGRSGSGKTTFASSWPKPMLLLDVKDEGTDSIKNVEGVEVLSVETFDDLIMAYWLLKSGKHHFKSVGIDTTSMLQDKALNMVLEEEGKEFASQQIWGKVSGIMKEWLLNFRDLADEGIHVHFIAQDRLTESDAETDDEQIDPEIGPQLMPSVARALNASVKVIGNTYIGETVKRVEGKIQKHIEYRMRIGPHAYYITKIRKPKEVELPDFLKDPTFNDILGIMKGELPKKESKPKTNKKPTGRKKPVK